MRIEGADEVSEMFTRMGDEHPKELRDAAKATLRKMESTAKSIGTSTWHKRPQVSVPAMSVTETDGGGYLDSGGRGGFFQEVGTVNHPPKPAIQPAVDAHLPEFWDRVERILK